MKYNVEVPIDHIGAPEVGQSGYTGFETRSEVLKKGWSSGQPGAKPLEHDILVEHDVPIKVRDGVTLYADIFRPPGTQEKVPAILCWGPFGKQFSGIISLKVMHMPWNLGVPDNTLSGLEKFEAPDPADYVSRGYAMVNIDSRGAFDSEGVMVVMGTQEAEDGYDTIEWIAKQPWCSGNVGMAGNSHLAIVQWFIAALNPPSLKAIAPWEGCGDLYREQFARGGIYGGDLFDNMIVKYMMKGRNGVESFREMFQKHPLANDWWNDKRPDMKKINIPTYITGTYSNTMHGMGAIRGWLEVDSPHKWLRWHPTQEWHDMWASKQAKEELASFFDHYLKGIDNDWESTPRVRMAVLKFGDKPSLDNIVEKDFPIPRTQYRKAYLHPDNKLTLDGTPSQTSSVSYNSESPESFASFTYTFDKKTQLIGMPKAVLYMSCDDLDDMDVHILLRKISADGEPMLATNIPLSSLPISSIAEIPEKDRTEVILYAGPTGIQRASMRAIDTAKSMHENWPFYPMDKQEKVPPGEIVRLEVGIWAMGIEFEAGESIRLQVCGHYQSLANFGTSNHIRNKGKHIIHFGGEHDSHVVLPFV